MPVRYEQHFHNGLYFITFTCYKWLPLFEITNGYSQVYCWFDVLVEQGSHIVAYVIMPNHIHVIIAFNEHPQSINTRMGSGKRFIAYGLIDRLEDHKNSVILKTLSDAVNNTDRKRGKKHHVLKVRLIVKNAGQKSFLYKN